MSETLSELLERCRSGDPDAVECLVVRFQGWARDLADALLDGDAHAAEDVVQEAFVRALARLGELNEPAAFPGWFRQVIRTEASRLTRRRRARSSGRSVSADVVDVGASPPEAAATREQRELVRTTLSDLPRAGREAVELYYFEQRRCAEVAEILGVPTGTVKRRLHDARARLRELLPDPSEGTLLPREAEPPRTPL